MQVRSPFGDVGVGSDVSPATGLIKPVEPASVSGFSELFPVGVLPSGFKCYATPEIFIRGLKVREVKVLSKVEEGGLPLVANLFKDVITPIPVGDLLLMDFRSLALLSSFYTDRDFSLKFDVSCPHCRAKFRKAFTLEDLDYLELEAKEFPVHIKEGESPFVVLYPKRVKDELFRLLAESRLPEWDRDILGAAIQTDWGIADRMDFDLLKKQYDLIGDAPGFVWGLLAEKLGKLDPGLNTMGVDCPACKERFLCEFEIDLARALS